MENFDPTYPVLVGELLAGEERLGFMKVRVKKHRWHRRVLKSRDPLILSVGWRRVQVTPVYCVEEHNMRQRMLKYTPEHMHCIASLYGETTPPTSSIIDSVWVLRNNICTFFPVRQRCTKPANNVINSFLCLVQVQ